MVFFYSSLHQGSYDPISIKVPTNCHGKNSTTPQNKQQKPCETEMSTSTGPFSQLFFPPHPNRSQATQSSIPTGLWNICQVFRPSFSRVFPHCQTSQWGSSQHLLRQSSGVVEPHSFVGSCPNFGMLKVGPWKFQRKLWKHEDFLQDPRYRQCTDFCEKQGCNNVATKKTQKRKKPFEKVLSFYKLSNSHS